MQKWGRKRVLKIMIITLGLSYLTFSFAIFSNDKNIFIISGFIGRFLYGISIGGG